ncbi:hypothetical protein [Amycolatopsis jiangsuensis]|uniref:TetR family transcriptional regulator n=1 Tax=Amycolatopsis jiangsuensis TaxID=1181879 RepID=A0A840ITI6_9PSEU|nr:hypothetical protein [Amycolatopsis jiangsuensis]MBB4685180.1 hypothetical protein [Amycolatopsis jiangsuensis]
MSWNDFYRRREILDSAVRHARRAPAEPLELGRIPGATEVFGTEEALLLALHHQWSRRLGGHLRTEFAAPEDATADGAGDQVDAVSRAWRRALEGHETLRELLDGAVERCPALVPLHEAELRMLAITAGLVDPGEPRAEVTKVGHAFGALLRAGDARPVRRRSPIGHLRRLLAPTA